jgi:dTDP-glucose 4,6-dehydratase
VIEKGMVGETYNIGGGCEKTNLDVVGTLCSVMDDICTESPYRPYASLITYVKDRLGHDRRYAIDCTKIRKELGWEPKETFATGLRKTVQWYLGNSDWLDAVKSGSYRQWIRSHYGIE